MKDISKFWDRRSLKYDQSTLKRSPGFLAVCESAKKYLKASDRVLDFGCASGAYSIELAPFVQQMDGIDISPKMISLAKSKLTAGDKSPYFSTTDLFDSSFKPNTYDAILALNVFHLTPNVKEILERLNTLLKPGGLIISETPCLDEKGGFTKFLIKGLEKIKLIPPIRSFDSYSLEQAFIHENFELIQSEMRNKKDAGYWVVAKK